MWPKISLLTHLAAVRSAGDLSILMSWKQEGKVLNKLVNKGLGV